MAQSRVDAREKSMKKICCHCTTTHTHIKLLTKMQQFTNSFTKEETNGWTNQERMQAEMAYRSRLSDYVPMPHEELHLASRGVVIPGMNIDRLPQLNSRDEEEGVTATEFRSVRPVVLKKATKPANNTTTKTVSLRNDFVSDTKLGGCNMITMLIVGAAAVAAVYFGTRYLPGLFSKARDGMCS